MTFLAVWEGERIFQKMHGFLKRTCKVWKNLLVQVSQLIQNKSYLIVHLLYLCSQSTNVRIHCLHLGNPVVLEGRELWILCYLSIVIMKSYLLLKNVSYMYDNRVMTSLSFVLNMFQHSDFLYKNIIQITVKKTQDCFSEH